MPPLISGGLSRSALVWRALLLLHYLQGAARDESHGGGGVVAGAATGEIGYVEDPVGGEYVVAARSPQVP